jgi:hypothetical protein
MTYKGWYFDPWLKQYLIRLICQSISCTNWPAKANLLHRPWAYRAQVNDDSTFFPSAHDCGLPEMSHFKNLLRMLELFFQIKGAGNR